MTPLKVARNCALPDVTEKLHKLHDRLVPKPEAPRPVESQCTGTCYLSNEELITLACREKPKFQSLWRGEITGHSSHGEADLALLNDLAYYTAKDAGRMKELFMMSGLYRENGKGKDYLDRTIAKAIEDTTNVYQDDWKQQRNGTSNTSTKSSTVKSQPTTVEAPTVDEPQPELADDSGASASVIRLRIIVNNRQLHEVGEEAKIALQNWNIPPRLFSMGLRKVQVCERHENKQGPLTIDLHEHSFRDYLSQSADYIKMTNEGEERSVFPPIDIVLNLLHKPNEELGLPELEGVVSAPVVLKDGRILSKRGYDSASRLYYLPPPGLKLEDLSEHCDQQAAIAAREFLERELFSDFLWADEASKTNAVAAFLTPLVRHAMRLAPMFAIDATTSSSGKGLLSKLICLVATGQSAGARGLEAKEEEVRKAITAALTGNQAGVIVFDNVTGTVRSSALDRALTTGIWVDRELGRSKDIVAKQNACWLMTGNNVTIAGDLKRRICRIRLDPKTSRAYLRNPDTFRHEDIEAWTLENRNQILIALLTMIRAWWQARCPRPAVRPLGSFEEWTRTVGGILEFSGARDFMANFEANTTDMDSEDMDWSYWLRELEHAYSEGFSVAQLLQDLEAFDNKSNRVL